MQDSPGRGGTTGGRDSCLHVSLDAVASSIRASDGRAIVFSRAILTIRNVCGSEVFNVIPHATLGQEGGTVQDVSAALQSAGISSIPPGETVSYDVYDILLPAHPGTASKVHMFGYRAALNWRFDLAAWVEYHLRNSSAALQTPVSRWVLRWSVKDASAGEIGLTIEDVKD